jgi:N-acetylglucosaminyldiphosphoundecaprenol N-acetyl-beta-D-mannosaminyltransferase
VSQSLVHFLGIDIQSITPEEAVRSVLLLGQAKGRAFHLANSFTMVLANDDVELHNVLCADIVLCDGVPLARALKRQDPRMESVRGPSLMKHALAASVDGNRHFLLGGSVETLDHLVRNVEEKYPTAVIVGTHSPEYSPDWADKIDGWADLIRESQATIVWVGLGTPKQDYVVHEISARLNVTAVAVGAAFDFIAGTQPEAPIFLQGSGFEWLYRLLKEPKRLWRRYIFGNLRFLYLLLIRK